MNVSIVRGVLSRPPERRTLPSGDVLVAYEVTVPAIEERRAESVPVVWFDAPTAAADLEPDSEVLVLGRVRRRFFRAGGATQSRTEVVASHVVPTRHAKRAARLLLTALAEVEDEARRPVGPSA